MISKSHHPTKYCESVVELKKDLTGFRNKQHFRKKEDWNIYISLQVMDIERSKDVWKSMTKSSIEIQGRLVGSYSKS